MRRATTAFVFVLYAATAVRPVLALSSKAPKVEAEETEKWQMLHALSKVRRQLTGEEFRTPKRIKYALHAKVAAAGALLLGDGAVGNLRLLFEPHSHAAKQQVGGQQVFLLAAAGLAAAKAAGAVGDAFHVNSPVAVRRFVWNRRAKDVDDETIKKELQTREPGSPIRNLFKASVWGTLAAVGASLYLEKLVPQAATLIDTMVKALPVHGTNADITHGTIVASAGAAGAFSGVISALRVADVRGHLARKRVLREIADGTLPQVEPQSRVDRRFDGLLKRLGR